MRPIQIKQTKQQKGKGKEQTETSNGKPQRQTCKNAHNSTSILQLEQEKKTEMTEGKSRASGKDYTKLNANARQRKKSNKTQKRKTSRAENKARKNATKTTTLFLFTKMLQGRKKRREKTKQQEKILRTENKDSANRKSPKGLQNGKTKQQEANLGNEASCQQSKFFFSVSVF